jgi:oxygen-independent coproporphyrinogen-3 oxidase
VTSIYIHIPFCKSLCRYCDFTKFAIHHQNVDAYLDSLEKEIRGACKGALPRTIYIGGGTPTAMNAEQLKRLMNIVDENFDLSKLEEFTIEANPGDLTPEKCALLKNVTRVSLGVQTFDQDILIKIGRLHSQKDVGENIKNLKAVGIDNITIDLMYGLPTQTIKTIQKDLEIFDKLEINHVSVYSLILEEGTYLFNHKQDLPDEDEEYEQGKFIERELEKRGLKRYEISNFARINYESKHNLVYWNNEEYYGFGCGASGYINKTRYENTTDLQQYLQGITKINEHKLTPQEIEEERIFLGLRKVEGVNCPDQDTTDLEKKGLIIRENGRIRLSERGFELANEVMSEFIQGED